MVLFSHKSLKHLFIISIIIKTLIYFLSIILYLNNQGVKKGVIMKKQIVGIGLCLLEVGCMVGLSASSHSLSPHEKKERAFIATVREKEPQFEVLIPHLTSLTKKLSEANEKGVGTAYAMLRETLSEGWNTEEHENTPIRDHLLEQILDTIDVQDASLQKNNTIATTALGVLGTLFLIESLRNNSLVSKAVKKLWAGIKSRVSA